MVGAYTVLQALQAAHLRAEATLLTPRVARSLRDAAGLGDGHGLRLEELHLLLDDLSNAMPASSASSASNVRIISPERREQSRCASLELRMQRGNLHAEFEWRGVGSSPPTARGDSALKAAIWL